MGSADAEHVFLVESLGRGLVSPIAFLPTTYIVLPGGGNVRDTSPPQERLPSHTNNVKKPNVLMHFVITPLKHSSLFLNDM